MKFWDSSALVPAVVAEPTSAAVRDLLRSDPQLTVAWHCEIECASAISRLERTGRYTGDEADHAFGQLSALQRSWTEIQPIASIRAVAIRLLRLHELRAADALQLASALVAAEGHPSSLELVSLDDRLAAAARREGFPVVVPPAA